MQHFVQSSISLLTILYLSGLSSQALAQAEDTEPNNSCFAAQEVLEFDGNSPLIVTGSLDTPPDEPDVDFFKLAGAPGAVLVADLEGELTGQGTLPDPLVGLFDSGCNLVDVNDDANDGTLNSRLLIIVPADGVFILAASGFADFEFTGAGEGSGSYRLSIALAPPPVGSIAGRVIDATSGDPLPGSSSPFAFVDLLRCDADFCVEIVNSQSTDDQGRFRFDRDFLDAPLLAGTYQVIAVADEFEENATEPFDVAGGEDFDVGDLPLGPQPIAFAAIQPCEDLLPQGDSCRYSVTVRNNTNAPVDGLAWSLVDGFELGSSLTFTRFEASTVRGSRQAVRAPVRLEPFADQVLQFRFDVPALALGATFCTEVYLGVDPDPLVTAIRQTFLFCIAGTDTGFEVMRAGASQKVSRSLRGGHKMLPKLGPAKPGQRPTE